MKNFTDKSGDSRTADLQSLTSFAKKEKYSYDFFGTNMPKWDPEDKAYLFEWQFWNERRIDILETYLANHQLVREVIQEALAAGKVV